MDLTKLQATSILVAGDIMLDHYISGVIERISPEAPVPILQVRSEANLLGGAGNVAANIASLSGSATILAAVGQDEDGETLKQLLAQSQIHFSLARSQVPTIRKSRLLAHAHQLMRVDFDQKILIEDQNQFRQDFRSLLQGTAGLILSDYNKGTLFDLPSMIEEARRANVRVFLDPKSTDFSIYAGSFAITPNLKEFEAVVGTSNSYTQMDQKGRSLCEAFSIENLIVTLGAKGALLMRPGREFVHFPADMIEVFDVTGAGDTFIAALALAVSSGATIEDATLIANTAAQISVTKAGAAQVSVAEIEAALIRSGRFPPQRKQLDLHALKQRLAHHRSIGHKIVMTNGCFDLLHAGHTYYLQRARELGDVLVVAVNSDASVKRLKGSERPINHLQNRLDVLSALGCVDYVISFDEDTPEILYAALTPDILVKGSDYEGKEIAGADHVRAAGGQIALIEMVPGLSSSALIKKMDHSK